MLEYIIDPCRAGLTHLLAQPGIEIGVVVGVALPRLIARPRNGRQLFGRVLAQQFVDLVAVATGWMQPVLDHERVEHAQRGAGHRLSCGPVKAAPKHSQVTQDVLLLRR